MMKSVIVVRVGSGSVLHWDHEQQTQIFAVAQMGKLFDAIRTLQRQGFIVVLVASGAMAAGLTAKMMDFTTNKGEQLSCAAIGIKKLARFYDDVASNTGIQTCHYYLNSRQLYDGLNAEVFCQSVHQSCRNTDLLSIVFENSMVEGVAANEIDNDAFAARVAISLSAKMLFLTSTYDFLFCMEKELRHENHTPVNAPKPHHDTNITKTGIKHMSTFPSEGFVEKNSCHTAQAGVVVYSNCMDDTWKIIAPMLTGHTGFSAEEEFFKVSNIRNMVGAAKMATASGIYVGFVNGSHGKRINSCVNFLLEAGVIEACDHHMAGTVDSVTTNQERDDLLLTLQQCDISEMDYQTTSAVHKKFSRTSLITRPMSTKEIKARYPFVGTLLSPGIHGLQFPVTLGLKRGWPLSLPCEGTITVSEETYEAIKHKKRDLRTIDVLDMEGVFSPSGAVALRTEKSASLNIPGTVNCVFLCDGTSRCKTPNSDVVGKQLAKNMKLNDVHQKHPLRIVPRFGNEELGFMLENKVDVTVSHSCDAVMFNVA